MEQKKILFYDCEIAKCIPDRFYEDDPKYEYCKGWHDYKNMGIACIAAYANWKGYNVFLGNQLEEFKLLAEEAEEIIGFNSLSFDDRLLAANSVNVQTTYDLLIETWVAAGMPPVYTRGVTRSGYKLENLAKVNCGRGKSGTGELAPQQWQEGEYRKVIDYCLNDVRLLVELYEMRSHLIDPTNKTILRLRGGSRWEWWNVVSKNWWVKQHSAWQTCDLRIFLWAVTNSDISKSKISISPFLKFSIENNSLILKLMLPKVKISLANKIYEDFEKATGLMDTIPF